MVDHGNGGVGGPWGARRRHHRLPCHYQHNEAQFTLSCGMFGKRQAKQHEESEKKKKKKKEILKNQFHYPINYNLAFFISFHHTMSFIGLQAKHGGPRRLRSSAGQTAPLMQSQAAGSTEAWLKKQSIPWCRAEKLGGGRTAYRFDHPKCFRSRSFSSALSQAVWDARHPINSSNTDLHKFKCITSPTIY